MNPRNRKTYRGDENNKTTAPTGVKAENDPAKDTTTVTGKAEPGATITVKDKKGDVIGTGTAGKDGSFTIEVPKQPSGDTVSVTGKVDGKGESAPVTITIRDKMTPKPEEPTNSIEIQWWIPWFSTNGSTGSQTGEVLPLIQKHEAYVFGYPDGTVRPDGDITRAEACAILVRLAGFDKSDASTPQFQDTKDPQGWYNGVINAAVKNQLVNGYPDGTFRPNERITRGEFAKMISALKQSKGATSPFTDVQNHWAKEFIDMAYGNGYITGYPDGTFGPDKHITRAEAVTMTNRLFERSADKEHIDGNPSETKRFVDLTKDHWAYYEMKEATNDHKFYRNKGQGEVWTEVNR